MDAYCLLCYRRLPTPTVSSAVPLQEDPDAICPVCLALSPEDRRALREQAMVRLMRRASDGRF